MPYTHLPLSSIPCCRSTIARLLVPDQAYEQRGAGRCGRLCNAFARWCSFFAYRFVRICNNNNASGGEIYPPPAGSICSPAITASNRLHGREYQILDTMRLRRMQWCMGLHVCTSPVLIRASTKSAVTCRYISEHGSPTSGDLMAMRSLFRHRQLFPMTFGLCAVPSYDDS